jgi:hypothetical protein
MLQVARIDEAVLSAEAVQQTDDNVDDLLAQLNALSAGS